MNRNARLRQRGFAVIIALTLLALLAVMTTAILRETAAQRRYHRLLKEQAAARCLAESGIAEAMHALAHKPGVNALARKVRDGKLTARWQPAADAANVYVVTAEGIARADEPGAFRMSLSARVEVRPQGDGRPATVRIVSWNPP